MFLYHGNIKQLFNYEMSSDARYEIFFPVLETSAEHYSYNFYGKFIQI